MQQKHYFAVRLCMLFFFCTGIPAVFASGSEKFPAPLPVARHRFIVIAHRGLHNLVPENSLAAFDAGARAGVDYVEMDLRTTKDSVLVILHDATLDRTTTGKGAVDQWTYDGLKKLKLKTGYGISAESVPSFEEVLALCRNRVYVYLDFKSASIPQTMSMIRKYKMEDQVIVYINSASQYAEWRSREPAMPLMLSLPDSVKTVDALDAFLAVHPAALLDGDYNGYSKAMVAAAESKNIPAWPDIQGSNESAHWADAVATGFHGLQTDHPEALISWLEERKLR